MVFPFKEKGFLCSCVCDCYFGLLILLIILFGTQQVVSKLRLEWKRWSEKKARFRN